MLKLNSMTVGGQRLPRFSEVVTSRDDRTIFSLELSIFFPALKISCSDFLHDNFSGVSCDINESHKALVQIDHLFSARRGPLAVPFVLDYGPSDSSNKYVNKDSNPIGFFCLALDDLEDICV